VLFLDELPEFDRAAREALRQPLEEGRIAIARVGGAVEMPARFQQVAAMNPCPCGWAGDPSGRCTCPIGLPDRYAARVSGPFRDRLDLWIGVPRVGPQALLAHEDGEASALVAARVAAVRAASSMRVGAWPDGCRAAPCGPPACSMRLPSGPRSVWRMRRA